MRLDAYLASSGLVSSRTEAKRYIESGLVLVGGVPVTKPSFDVDESNPDITLLEQEKSFVGRGGIKLDGALDSFDIAVRGKRCLDVGASSGGFTDCLLQRGAAHVYAVDAGAGQLAPKLAQDVRVTSMEHTNARELTPDMIGGTPVDLIVMDVSFISATYILPRFPALLREGGHAVCLIKPQFEVGRAMLGKGGIVRDPVAHRYAVERVLDASRALGLVPVGLIPSPIEGGDGNREFLVHLIRTDAGTNEIDERTVATVTRSAHATSPHAKKGN